MHPHMLYDVIRRQAGTLLKAVFELVMNAVDAKAKNIAVTITNKTVRVTDDGVGMTDKKHIQKYWRTFGQPPEEHEKKTYGQFRMGRGQAFAFGKNRWRTSQFEMAVDIMGTGLKYQLNEKLPEHKGCDVQIELYNPISEVGIYEIVRELPIGVKYVPAVITVNDKPVSNNPAEQKWTQETDEAYIRLRDTGNLYVYNLGVLVSSHPTHTYGCGGEVVSKKQLTVNFARNEVMSTCPVWKAIRPIIDKRASERISRAPALNDGSRQRLIDKLLAGDKDIPRSTKLLTDACGRHWGIGLVNPHAFNKKLTIAPLGDQKADKVMQTKMAFVISDQSLEQFGVSSLKELYKTLRTSLHKFDEYGQFELVKFSDLTNALKDRHDIIPDREWSVQETVVIRVIKKVMYTLLGYQYSRREAQDSDEFDDEIRRSTRALYLGSSDCAEGWTDGDQFIAIDRKFIAKTGLDIQAWASYGMLMIHELCHDQNDQGTHLHGQDFYENYHDWTTHALPGFVDTALSVLPAVIRSVEGAYNKTQAKLADKVSSAQAAASRVTSIKEARLKK